MNFLQHHEPTQEKVDDPPKLLLRNEEQPHWRPNLSVGGDAILRYGWRMLERLNRWEKAS